MTVTGKVLIVQDRPESYAYQERILRAAAAPRQMQLDVEWFDLRRPSQALLDRLAAGAARFDWMVTDLLRDNVDHDPLTAAGLRLLRSLIAQDLFGHYQDGAVEWRGVRCIAICSVCVDHGSVPNPDLRRELERLGLQARYFARGGDIGQLAQEICAEIAEHGGRGASDG